SSPHLRGLRRSHAPGRGRLTRILVVTDAWAPQVNGVVRSLENVLREAPRLGVDIEMLTPSTFRTVPLPTYREVRIALTRPGVIAQRIEEAQPDYITSPPTD